MKELFGLVALRLNRVSASPLADTCNRDNNKAAKNKTELQKNARMKSNYVRRVVN